MTYIAQYNIKKINTILLFVLVGLFLGYMYMVGNVIFDVVAQNEIKSTNRTLMSEISSLELGTLSIQNNLNISFAKSLGFVESTPRFATRAAFVVR